MKYSAKTLVSPLLISLLTACGGGSSATSSPETPTEPVNSSPTVSIEGASSIDEESIVSLKAVASDSDGQIVSYQWQLLDNTNISVDGLNTETVTFSAPDITEDLILNFEVTVEDDDNASVTATHQLTVKFVNQAPISNAGEEINAVQHDTVYLYDGGSIDPDGQELSSVWEIEEAPDSSTAEIEDNLRFTPDVPGTYVIRLTVSDGELEDSDTVVVNVERFIDEWVYKLEEDHNIPADLTIEHCLDNKLLKCEYNSFREKLVMIAKIGSKDDLYQVTFSDAFGGGFDTEDHWMEIDTPDSAPYSNLWENAWVVINSEEALRLKEAPSYLKHYVDENGETRLVKKVGGTGNTDKFQTSDQVYSLKSESINAVNFQILSEDQVTLFDTIDSEASKGLDSLLKMKQARLEYYETFKMSQETIGKFAELTGISRDIVELYCADEDLKMLSCYTSYVRGTDSATIALSTDDSDGTNMSLEENYGHFRFSLNSDDGRKHYSVKVLLRENVTIKPNISIVNDKGDICFREQAEYITSETDWDSRVSILLTSNESAPSSSLLAECYLDANKLFITTESDSTEYKFEVVDYKDSLTAFKALLDAGNF